MLYKHLLGLQNPLSPSYVEPFRYLVSAKVQHKYKESSRKDDVEIRDEKGCASYLRVQLRFQGHNS